MLLKYQQIYVDVNTYQCLSEMSIMFLKNIKCWTFTNKCNDSKISQGPNEDPTPIIIFVPLVK